MVPCFEQCPGGGDLLACNGNGNCSDGIQGNGQCDCFEGWTGYSCETCTFSNCTGFIIEECNLTCPNNSRCENISGEAVCVCEWPYVDHLGHDGPLQCKEVDFCTIPPLCHINATCTQDADTLNKNCTCNDGYHGDGYVCDPTNPCQINNGGCDEVTTDCNNISPGKSTCICKEGYHEYVPNYGCSLIDICHLGLCHSKASCETVYPNIVRCTCREGYDGDGQNNCTGNILQTLKDLNKEDPDLQNQLNLIITALETFYKDMVETSDITVFIPLDSGFKTIGVVDKWLSNDVMVKALLRQHIVVGAHTLDELTSHSQFYTLDGTAAEIVTYRRNKYAYSISPSDRKAPFVQLDIPASNGYIHITKRLLIDSLPELGSQQMTVDSYIGSLHVFSTFNLLVQRAGDPVKLLLQQPGVTVFVPPNEAWDRLPWDSLDYLIKPENVDKVEVILKNHILNETHEVVEFLYKKRYMTASGYIVNVDISKESLGRFTVNGEANITNANIQVENGLLMQTDAVLVPDGISTLPNFCNEINYESVMGPCGNCREEAECFAPDVPMNETAVCEYFARNEDGQYEKLSGCAPMCNRSVIIPRCCDGFYGYDCLPCPGGYRTPCSGNGFCHSGTGECKCNQNFKGRACSDCENDNQFGPDCTQECTCVEGVCNNGPSGDGNCRYCLSPGVFGENCDKLLHPCQKRDQHDIHCHVHALCWKFSSRNEKCICNEGYTGDGENLCTEIDPCQLPDYGGCHQQATCVKTGPGTNNCTCNHGFSGDGTYCAQALTCGNHSDCHLNASCIETFPGSHVCRCHDGYEGDGKTSCHLQDMCSVNNGGCHTKAVCTNIKPGQVNCTCQIDKGYSGNGYTCDANLVDTILDTPDLSWLHNVLKARNQLDLELLLDNNYTVFAPNDRALFSFYKSHAFNETYKQWLTRDVLLTYLNYLSFPDSLTVDQLVSMSQFSKIETMVDGYYLHLRRWNESGIVEIYSLKEGPSAVVMKSDIIATNGYLNIIDNVLIPDLPQLQQDDDPDLETFFNLHPEYSVFGEWLMKKNLTTKLEEDFDQYTIFVPNNHAMEHLKQTITSDYLLYYVIERKVMMMSTDSEERLLTALGSKHQLVLHRYSLLNITVNGVDIVKPDMLTFGGIVHGLDGLLHPVIHRCTETSQSLQYSYCRSCEDVISCKYLYDPVQDVNDTILPCQFRVFAVGLSYNFKVVDGCKGLCYQNVTTDDGCCAGYYGKTCAECPGGPETPCSGHGKCNDGINGNGKCVCDKGFTGYICDRCKDGWTGANCETDMSSCAYRNGGCDEDAVCSMDSDSKISCTCPEGYDGDGYNCTGPCDLQNGGCHGRAKCSFQLHQGISCSCRSPFVGEGKTFCNADVYSTLLTLHGITNFVKSVKQLSDQSLVTDLKNLSLPLKYTLFVPVDKGLEYPFVSKEQYLQQLVRWNRSVSLNSHLFKEQNLMNMMGNLLQLTFDTKKSLFYVNETYVVKGNIPCTNGIIHLMSGPFTPVSKVMTSKSSSRSHTTEVIVPIVTLLCIILISVGFIIWKKKSKASYWKTLKEWSTKHNNSIANQKEPIDEADEKEDVMQSDTNFGNPLYLVQNLE